MPFKRSLLLFLLALADALPSRAGAQRTTAVDASSSLQTVLSRVGSGNGRALRLASKATGRVETRAVYLRDDSVVIHTELGMRAIAVADVDSLWVQRGTAAALVGTIAAIPCLLFGAGLGEFLATDPDGNGWPGGGLAGVAIGGVAGGAVCGLVGAGVGSLFRLWRLEYARRAT